MVTSDAIQPMQAYEYRPLRPGPNNIRLLQILPGTGDADVFCQVFQYTLRTEKAFGLYEALSYVWGDSADPHQIRVKNAEDEHYRTFSVTKNLFAALLRLRDADLPRTLWVDAICINQNNLAERASQVQIMARIYAYAVSVTVWLGEGDDASSQVLNLMRRIVADDVKYSYDWRATAKAIIAPASEAIFALLNRSWFRRAWVVQEAAVARIVSVTCGDAETSGSIFASGMDMALSLLRRNSTKYTSVPPVLMFMNQSSGPFPLLQKLADLQPTNSMPSFNVLPLGDLLRLFQGHEATDKRDKIYALLGLSSDNDVSPQLRPDYTKSWSTLFQQVITHVLGSSPTVKTDDDTEQAVIFESGSVLGTVSLSFHDQLFVKSPVFGGLFDHMYHWRASWTLPHHCGSIKDGDILVFFQNARRPSVIRPCGDHFDIIMISLPSPPIVTVALSPPRSDWEDFNLAWADFAQGARRSLRKFHLIWDWTDSSDSVNHETLLDQCEDPASESLERRFTSARVLDDLFDLNNLRNLLANRTPTNDSRGMEKHLILLDHTLVHWGEYVRMKHYFTTLQWCIWSLKAPINTDYLLDYWHYAGSIGSDLYEILNSAEHGAEKAMKLGNEYHRYCWSVELWQDELYPLIFPSYSPRIVLGGRSPLVSPHNGRYLARLVVASQPSIVDPSEATILRLYNSVYFNTQFDAVLMILAEQWPRSFLEPYLADLALQRFPHVFDTGLLACIFCELAYSSAATWSFLENLLAALQVSEDQDELFFSVLWPNQMALFSQFDSEYFCEHEMDLWINSNRPFNSVLRFIIASLVPYQWMKWKDSEVSLHKTTNMFTIDFLVRWALGSVQDAILGYQREQRRRRSSDSSMETVRTTVKSATASVKSASTTSSKASARAVVAPHNNRFK